MAAESRNFQEDQIDSEENPRLELITKMVEGITPEDRDSMKTEKRFFNTLNRRDRRKIERSKKLPE
jgi:hypothetical protein